MTDQRSGDVAEATLREYRSGQKLFGRYMLVKILGRGGMGIVWLARDEELEREVALKFLPDVVVHDRSLLNELKRETRRSLELTHRNIVRIHDFVFNESSACISMEYVDGNTLANLRVEKEQKVFARSHTRAPSHPRQHPNRLAFPLSLLVDKEQIELLGRHRERTI